MKLSNILACILLGTFTPFISVGSLAKPQSMHDSVHTPVHNSIGMPMVTIPAGHFYMGSDGKGISHDERPVHKVVISEPFLMSATEVTNAQYEKYDPNHKELRGKVGLSTEDNEAVIFVNYHDAVAFCEWLSEKEGKPYRLPTEAEWEYACRAGSTTNFSMGDSLPSAHHKNQINQWGVVDTLVHLHVGMHPANAFGLYDMHGNVEEWCSDWYGPYNEPLQTDPVGRIDGDFKVTRGGSHSTPVEFLRSANRSAMIPEDNHWLTGFRVVQAAKPTTTPLPVVENPLVMQHVSQQKYNWPNPISDAFFAEPLIYVKQPDSTNTVPFYNHNHCPAITWCNNGDLLVIWFSTNDEAGREMTILGSRMRAGSKDWEQPSEFFKVPDRNMTGSALFHDDDGTLMHFNGIEAAGSWENLIVSMRTSTDNGASWSKPRLITQNHEMRNQVIAGTFKTREGWLVQACDATPHSYGGTALHISKDGGKTWNEQGKGVPHDFTQGGTGGTIAGIHAGVVQLANGDFMALGRGDNIADSNGILKMPMSISKDQGKTWQYSASDFPPIFGGQRLVLFRLNEGPLMFVSFTHHSDNLINGVEGLTFTDQSGKEFTGYGMYAALSYDDGKTWPVKKLITDSERRILEGGAWTGSFVMDQTHAEPRGYLAVAQTPDNTIHLVSSRLHYRLNLQWLLNRAH